MDVFRATPSEEHAVMIWDGAGFHHSKTLCMPENITPLQLPANSPELNPLENLWHYLKSHHWSNRTYPNAEALEEAVMQAWKLSVMNNKLMQSVCSDKTHRRAGNS
ncbi:MAG: transposase [Pirellulales bacterium]